MTRSGTTQRKSGEHWISRAQEKAQGAQALKGSDEEQ
jgi:hypothetical protein